MIVNGEKRNSINIENLPENDWRKHPENTKWGIGWLPMGGYVKIAGMVDESMDTEQLKNLPNARIPKQTGMAKMVLCWVVLPLIFLGLVYLFLPFLF